MKLRLILAGTVCLAAGLSGHLASAQVADEILSTGTRSTVYDNPHTYTGGTGGPLLGYDEKCGPDDDEDCFDEDGDDEDTSDTTTPTDVVLVVGERRRRFNLVVYLMEQLASNFTEPGGFTSNDEWFLDHGIMPVPYAFYVNLIESIEQAMDLMLANLYGELTPQLISLGLLTPMDAATLLAKFDELNRSISELAEQLRQLSVDVNINSADIEAVRAVLNSTVISLDSTISILADIQAGIDNNSSEFAQLAGVINNLNRTRDAVIALRLMGVGN